MCGIAGLLGHGAEGDAVDAVSTMVRHQHHRGPDASRVVALDGAVLGSNRLAILDRRPHASTPMSDPTGRWWLVYNGELYNYVEVRDELAVRGWHFRTDGDTEVVLAALVTWGPDAVQRFNGMWALAYYDTTRRCLLLSRDRFGEKPLNYAWTRGGLMFASEPNAMVVAVPALGQPDEASVAAFLRHSRVADGEATFYRTIRRLPAAHSMTITGASTRMWRHWVPPQPPSADEVPSLSDAAEEFGALLADSVRLRLRADVPVATTLSGGLDSSSIATLAAGADAQRHTTYTAAYPGEPFDESAAAAQLSSSLGVRHVTVPDPAKRLDVDLLDRVVRHMSGPTANPATIPLWHLMQAIRDDGTVVVLDGQGADELLGGYTDQVAAFAVRDLVRSGRPAAATGAWVDFARTWGLQPAVSWTIRSQVPATHALFRRVSGLESVLGPVLLAAPPLAPSESPDRSPASDCVNRTLARQQRLLLRTLLDYGDTISMAHSVEVRLPYTDHRLVEQVMRLPGSYKVRGGTGKVLQRKALRPILPAEVFERPKLGFVTPVGSWFRGRHRDEWTSFLTTGSAVQLGLLSSRGVRRLLAAPPTRSRDLTIFKAATLETWLRQLARPPSVDLGHHVHVDHLQTPSSA